MNNITYAVSVDVNNPIIPYNVYVASVLDSNVRYLEITLYQNGNVIVLSNTATATASLVTDNVLVDDSVACTISNNIITVPLEDLQRHGNLDVQVTVTEDTKVLAIPFPIQVRVTPNIAENAQIDENSLGSYAEVVHEIAEARGSYDKLKDRLDHTTTVLALKANAADVYTKTEADGALSRKVDTSTFNHQLGNVIAALNTKADAEEVYKKSEVYSKSEVDEAVNNKTIDSTHIENGAVTEGKLSADVRNKLNGITPGGDIDLSDYYTKDEVDSALLDKSDKSSVYTKAEIDAIVGTGRLVDYIDSHSHTGDEVNYPSVNAVRNYSKSVIDDWGDAMEEEINDIAADIPTKTSDLTNDSGFLTSHQDISGKADKATTLAGYGITNAYTKAEVDGKIGSGSVVQVIGNQPQTGDDVNYPSVSAARNYTKLLANEVKGLMEDAIGELSENIPTKTSDLTNDANYLTLATLPIYNGGVQ